MTKYTIKIYVAKDEISTHTVKEMNDALKGTEFGLKIVDVQKFPEEAEKNNIIVTPTIIKELPPPLKRLIGGLAGKEKILVSFDIKQ
jgi:circadian clock protein KaiB